MIHQPLGGYRGQASDIEIHARETLLVKDRLNRIMAKHTVKRLSKSYMTLIEILYECEEAVEYGPQH